ncbi:pentatricopeptide repeat-containing protein, putative [Perkinsus marinus ATCC 50983]|uniref:Pentatricopeptide repeat-containing protein, putative n=1 Tax=Perkinsus marinus (strain ATCC 50983 / TXsc) TaxID=423536 RepID=C5L869_PERM5|nr:pentatricopeptide repeat-containing protein, putative [Perkinsus marinus ATCC 50983]EER07095.1 pentatricopeptide repeat-containing protein, putative [Perkinsus marinus ATCC 50983]|eukprot:XP_002775279.1 pentatricopeptide repeat-containing protein, putative [Perkinsus marinus ATCC 50983]
MPSKELLSSIGSTRHLNKLLKSLKRGRWASTEQARDLLDKAGMQNVVPDAFTYSQAFSMDAYSCSEIKALVSGSLHMLNSVVVNSAIASCGRMGCESEARELLRLSEDNNMATCRTYNAFLSLPMTGSAAMDVWKKIPHHMKDAYTLQLLLYRLAQDGYPPPVYENLLAEARDVMTIDRQHLATAVSGCIRAGYAADGLALLSASGVRASDDKVLATCALCAYERLGMWSESLDLLQCIDEPDVVCYTVAIAACARAGKGKEAIKLWSELSSRGLTPQRQTLSSVVRACEAAGEYEEAIRILSSISDLSARADDGVRIGNKFASSRPEQITVEYRDLLCDRLELSLHESRITSSDGSIGVADHRGGRVFINHNLSSTVLPTPKLLHVLKPKPEERSAALEAIERLKGVLESVGFTCVEYGAAAAGLALPNSDVDVTLLLNGTPSTQAWLSSLSEVEKETYPHREIAQAQLLTLHRTLNETQQFTVVATGLGGRVPVVTIVHNPTSIVMDGCDDEAHAGGFEDPVKTAAGCVELLKMVSGYLTECAAPGIISTAPVVITSSRVPLITLACRDPALDDELYQQ